MKIQREIDKRLIEAARAGSLLEVQALVAQGADVNARGEVSGCSALMSAACHYPVFTWLLDHGADLNYCDGAGCDALSLLPDKALVEQVLSRPVLPSPTKRECGSFITTTEKPGFANSSSGAESI